MLEIEKYSQLHTEKQVFFHRHQTHPDITACLRHYERQDFHEREVTRNANNACLFTSDVRSKDFCPILKLSNPRLFYRSEIQCFHSARTEKGMRAGADSNLLQLGKLRLGFAVLVLHHMIASLFRPTWGLVGAASPTDPFFLVQALHLGLPKEIDIILRAFICHFI